MKRLMVLLTVGLLAGGLLAGCSGSGSEAAPVTVELSSTTSSTAAPTTTSTSEATTTTVDPNIALVEAVYWGFHESLLLADADMVVSGLERFAGDPLLTILLTNTRTRIAEGVTVGESLYDVHILEISVQGDVATVRSCDLDGVSFLTASGEIRTPADTERYLRVAGFELIKGDWKMVSRTLVGSKRTSCVAG